MSDETQQTQQHRGGHYLAALPDGWAYEVVVRGPDGQIGEMKENLTRGLVTLMFTADTITRRTGTSPDLSSAAKVTAAAVRALVKAEKEAAKVQQAQESALSLLGPAS